MADEALPSSEPPPALLTDAALLERARARCYQDAAAAAADARELASRRGPLAAHGWLHLALAEVRQGSADDAAAALAAARAGFEARDDADGLAWCDEVAAIALRRQGDYSGSLALQAEIDRREGITRDPLYRFVALNSRAIGAKLAGDYEGALRLFYAALAAADETGLAGPRITALGNLGGYHQDLFNFDDARSLSEQALAEARAADMRAVVTVSTANLVFICHALGEMDAARSLAASILERPDEQLPAARERFPLALALGHLAVGEHDAALAYLGDKAVTAIADGDGVCDWTWILAQCLLARGDAAGARRRIEAMLAERARRGIADQPYPMMQLLKTLAEACERLGDHPAALEALRQAHSRYVDLVGRSARARQIALVIGHRLEAAQRERDLAVQGRMAAEDDRRRLAELNAALELKIAETEALHQQLREQALRDSLTGLHNRRYLYEAGVGALELARRQQRIACVALLDLDHFKRLNDTHGHHVGDLVLQRFATLLRSTLRRSDIICRFGGEEFVAVMPDLDAEAAEKVLERLQRALNAEPEPQGRRRLPGASFSAGIALFPHHGTTLEKLLRRADKALYLAKELGRARVEQPPETGFSSLS